MKIRYAKIVAFALIFLCFFAPASSSPTATAVDNQPEQQEHTGYGAESSPGAVGKAIEVVNINVDNSNNRDHLDDFGGGPAAGSLPVSRTANYENAKVGDGDSVWAYYDENRAGAQVEDTMMNENDWASSVLNRLRLSPASGAPSAPDHDQAQQRKVDIGNVRANGNNRKGLKAEGKATGRDGSSPSTVVPPGRDPVARLIAADFYDRAPRSEIDEEKDVLVLRGDQNKGSQEIDKTKMLNKDGSAPPSSIVKNENANYENAKFGDDNSVRVYYEENRAGAQAEDTMTNEHDSMSG
eukprot:g3058.t1